MKNQLCLKEKPQECTQGLLFAAPFWIVTVSSLVSLVW